MFSKSFDRLFRSEMYNVALHKREDGKSTFSQLIEIYHNKSHQSEQ